jgi:hypothetical protein
MATEFIPDSAPSSGGRPPEIPKERKAKAAVRPVVVPRINIAASLQYLLHDLKLVRASLEAQIERLDRIERELKAVLQATAPGATLPLAPSGEPVVYNLLITPQANGSAELVINGGGKVQLAAQLTEVFKYLASGSQEPGEDDALAGWRARDEIVQFLEKNTGRKMRRGYVNQIVYALREALQRGRYDRRFIQTHRKKGVRVAYRRRAGAGE